MAEEALEPIKTEDLSYTIAPNVSVGSNRGSASQLYPSEDSAMTTADLATSTDDTEVPESLPAHSAMSQPMTASTSSSSNPSLKDAAVGTASPYGTRSRHRAGVSRPNYAEDRETEVEFEIQPTEEDDIRKLNRAGVGDARSSTTQDLVTIRRGLPLDYNTNGQVISKDQIPGTSTFSSNPAGGVATQLSKKRKANGQTVPNSSNTLLPVINSTSSGSQTNTRRASIATQSLNGIRESNMLSFENCAGHLKHGKLVADDGTILAVNDHVYLVCEPPGEPYYLGRIMEFLHINNDPDKAIDALRMNWYYRPKDIGRKVSDTRQVFASMHSDTSPLTALRGLCQIRHKSEVHNMEEYKRTQNCFWYEKLYDRYIHRYYEVIPTNQIVNVPAHVKRVLDERWKFILVESGRGKELTSAVKSCKRCSGYCASNDSVDCAVCHQTYHMNCVRPPLLKKPSRGFAWACGPCSRAQERKLEARNTPNLTDPGLEVEDEEIVDEEEDDGALQGDDAGTGRTSPTRSVDGDLSVHPGTAEQIYQASLWPFRYLGVHCKVEDALDYDDRIYPRASSRLGPRHQANVTVWHGRPVELVKPAEIKKKYMKGGTYKKDAKLSKETIAALEAEKMAREKRPKWVIDEPPGYVHRGEDHEKSDPNNTAELLYKPPQIYDSSPGQQGSTDGSMILSSSHDQLLDDYMVRAKQLAKHIGVPDYSVNFLDKALSIFYSTNYDIESALGELAEVQKRDLMEPELTAAEIKKFEDGIARFGSELHSVKKHVKGVASADIVRFYYTWKKTDRGKQIWGNYAGRKGKKQAKKAEASAVKLQDDVADDHDDSAFDNEKAFEKKRGFQCKFCGTRSSRQWRRAPNTAAGTTVPSDLNNKPSGKEKVTQLMVALCLNCAVVWRKYAVQWEEGDEHGKKTVQNIGKATKRKGDETLSEFQLNDVNWTGINTEAANTPTGGTPVPQNLAISAMQEPSRKKAKAASEKDQVDTLGADSGVATFSYQKKKTVEKAAYPPPAPEIPKAKLLPCAICFQMEPLGDQHLSCKECRMTVHRNCYGIVGETRVSGKWICDMCSNDRNPQVSVHYKCTLCPIEYTEQDFMEPPKLSHKKKSEKEREKDRVEREIAQKGADYYRKKQEEMGRPVNPREPLKRTANNNWVHVTCAVWTPEVKFGNAKALEPSEGIPSIPSARYDETCRACKRSDNGACVACYSCRAPVHVECAHQHGYILGFDIAPVKGSRRDQFHIVSINGEAGTMTAAIWCKEHAPTKTIVHRMHDIVDETGLNALQLYVQNFKQADLTLTGTVRKATLVNQSTKIANPVSNNSAPNRRISTTLIMNNSARGSVSNIKLEEISGIGGLDLITSPESTSEKPRSCVTCGVDVSPKWWLYPAVSFKTSTAADFPLSDNHLHNQTDDLGTPQHTNKYLTNGQLVQHYTHESPKNQVALAVAALEEKAEAGDGGRDDYQCHKCHHRGVVNLSPSPPEATLPQEAIQGHPLAQPATSLILASPPSIQMATHYSWPAQGAYSPPGSQNEWSRPSPGTQHAITTVHQFNGSRSPHSMSNGINVNGQSQVRQSMASIPVSPHLNGSLGRQANNNYPTSPHRIISSTHQTANGTLVSYAATRPPPQHLTNGGPPLLAPENPFTSSGRSVHQHSSLGTSHASPPLSRETLPLNPEAMTQAQGPRPADGRVNGGASASPSLQNLLS